MSDKKSVRGGFVQYQSGPEPSRIVSFQFNPDVLERTLIAPDPTNRCGEFIRFTLELDACDSPEPGDPTGGAGGLHPILAALELLAESSRTVSDQAATRTSRSAVAGNGYTLFVWGSRRVVPIRFVQLTVRETMFDRLLNPLRAAVDITLEILSDAELSKNPRAKAILDVHLKQKEQLARQFGASAPTEELLTTIKNALTG